MRTPEISLLQIECLTELLELPELLYYRLNALPRCTPGLYSGGYRISPRVKDANPPEASTYDFAKFSQMKLKEFGQGGGASKILLCRSATAISSTIHRISNLCVHLS